MIEKLLCWIGIHEWSVTELQDLPNHDTIAWCKCKRCGIYKVEQVN